MQIEDFIPYYPYTTDSEFNNEIYKKKEFGDVTDLSSLALTHQTRISRYMSTYTIYDSLFVFHEMGTGKTCTAVNTIENIFKQNSNIKRALIILKGQSLIDNFINEIITVCAKDKYAHLQNTQRLRTKLRSRYEFTTYEVFSKSIKSKAYSSQYNDYIIVIDEIHNIITEKKEEYKVIHNFLHDVKNCKILLMSGTPMTNYPYEFSDIMNLILPLDMQIPTGKEFMELFYKNNNINQQTIQILKKKIRGKVSYLKSSISDVDKVFIGKTMGKLIELKIFPTFMKNIQLSAYTKLSLKDSDLFIAIRQAALFVFPDGSSGSSGFNKYIMKIENRNKLGESKNKYIIKDETFKQQCRNIETLEKFSSKYANIINNLQENSKELSLIFSEFVEGSGIVLFSKILEMYGFVRSTGKDTTKGKRYAIISNLTTSLKQTRNILKLFNDSSNRYGEYIQVILGSKVISEGFTLKNVSQVHILTPHWNYSEIDQTIARAYRLFSHDALIADGIKPILKIYQHVSMPEQNTLNIDLKMYEVSEQKDILIKKLERVIKESTFDCPFLINNNKVLGYDGKRICDYQSCDYSCDISSEMLTEDDTTYNLYYSEQDIKDTSIKIKEMLKKQYINLDSIPKIIIVKAIESIMYIYNKYNIIGYPCIDGDRIYLSPTKYDNNDSGNMYYYSNPVFKINNLFEEISKKYLYIFKIPYLLDDLKNNPSEYILKELPLHVQEELLEQSFLAPNSTLKKYIHTFYKKYIYNINNTTVSSLSYIETNKMRCLNNRIWQNCNDSVIDSIKNLSNDIKERAKEFGYYGIKIKNKFIIKYISSENIRDKRLEPRGRVCSTIDKSELLKILDKAGITDFDKEASKTVLCTLIEDWFSKNNLIMYT